MNRQHYILEQIKASKEAFDSVFASEVIAMVDMIVNTVNNGGKIYIAGNGGSASDADHFVGEMLGRFKMERKAIPAISLCSHIGALTAISNDYSYEEAFPRILIGLIKPEDIFIGISTSGKSTNILNCLCVADMHKAKSILLCGKNSTGIPNSTKVINVNSTNTARIQEAHGLIIHLVCDLVEKALFEK